MSRPTLLAPLAAVPFVLRRPMLVLLLAAPLMINMVVFGLVVGGLLRWVVLPTAGRIDTGWRWVDSVLQLAAGGLMGVLAVLAAGLLAMLLTAPVGAPFYDLASERIERELLRHRPELIQPGMPLWASIRHSVLEALRRLVLVVPLGMMSLALMCVPGVGGVLGFLLFVAGGALLLPLDAFSYPLDRRGMTMWGKIQWLRAHGVAWGPVGLGMALLAATPCAFAWLPALGAVAATRLYCDWALDNGSR
jgi:CysZ protein